MLYIFQCHEPRSFIHETQNECDEDLSLVLSSLYANKSFTIESEFTREVERKKFALHAITHGPRGVIVSLISKQILSTCIALFV